MVRNIKLISGITYSLNGRLRNVQLFRETIIIQVNMNKSKKQSSQTILNTKYANFFTLIVS